MHYIISELRRIVTENIEDKQEQLEFLSDLIDHIQNNSDVAIKELKIEYHELCEDDPPYCQECREILHNRSYSENRGEYFGTYCNEEINEWFCPNCGEIY
jgi:rubrerythrin